MRELALRIARKNAFLALFDGWGTLAADVAFISSTYAAHGAAAAHTHIHTLHVRTTFSVKEGIAFGSPLARRLKDIVVLGRRRRGFGI